MAEELLETLFESCVLDVLTPDTSISFPADVIIDDWLTSVKQPHAERRQAFFDEQLNLFLVMHIKHPSLSNPHDLHNPPRSLVDLLSHIQVSLEATYIPKTPNQDVPDIASLGRPRTSSVPKGALSLHPSIFPPNTPNPIPSTTESDRKYVQSEGTLLFSGIWGTKKATEESEKFALLFSESQRNWIAIYELSLIVSYLRLPFSDPLLCLTAATTLREKALSLSQSTHPLVAYLTKAGMISHLDLGAVMGGEEFEEDEENEDTGFEEINLFDGLTLGSSTQLDSESLYLPSTRLGNTTRQRLFSLPAISKSTRTPPSTSKQSPNHILRKSYRKILQTVSGFRVRMRTVFVPHVLLPRNSAFENDPDTHGDDGFESGGEEREAGNSERTVILCIEVENSGESGPDTGFSLERLDVKIGGEGATTRLIGWGEDTFNLNAENHLFPLLVGSMEQYNLLYVVSFWNTPNDQDNLLLTAQGITDGGELQRAVSITVYGKPYLTNEVQGESNVLSYPTRTFSSRWNCILDLSSRPREEPVDFHETSVGRSALPEPASPFPGRIALSSLISSPASRAPTPQAIAGKRHTLPGSITAARAVNPSANFRLSLPSREHPGGSAPLPASTIGFTPPSVALRTFHQTVSTTFGIAPPPSSGGAGLDVNVPPSEIPGKPFVTPPSPAYPMSSPGVAANAPYSQALGSQQGYSGPSIEIKRQRGTGMMTTVPQTPFPTVLNSQFGTRQEPLAVPSGEPVVVSVGLLPAKPDDNYPFGQRKIYPSDQFTLDIFVYNQSSWTRRFEVSYPDVDRPQRKTEQNRVVSESRGKGYLEELTASIAPPGILPLQNRVRVGPLKPSTCQSVRMDLLAISPGVHSIDILTLTDVETGYAVHLRSVMDIVIHERTVGEKHEKVP